MVSISNVDLVMAALRSRLRRVASEKRSSKTSASSGSRRTHAARGELGATLDAIRQLPPEEFERLLIRAVLETELGEAISEDSRFNSLVEQTCAVLQEDSDLKKAMQRIQRAED